MHCEWLHALNHRNISDISISADQLLLDRIVNKGIANGSDFNYLSDSSSGDDTRTGTGTPLYRNLQSTISEVRHRRTERSINELHSSLEERISSHQQPHLKEISPDHHGQHPVDISAIHTSFVPDRPSRWSSRVAEIKTSKSKSIIT